MNLFKGYIYILSTMDKININIIQLKKQEFKDLKQSQLILEISGKSVNTSLVNTIRRICYGYIPTYAFCKQSINIEYNNSIFDNDYMRLRLSQMTYPNHPNNMAYVPEKYWKNVDYSDLKREKFLEDKSIIEMYVNVSNSTTEIMEVTTNHVKFIENGEDIEKMDKKYPNLIIKLRPKEVFKCHAIGVLGVGLANDIWSGAANCYYEYDEQNDKNDKNDNNKFKFTIESQGQLDEYSLIYKACQILVIKLNNIKNIIKEKYDNDNVQKDTVLTIHLENEDHTIGNIINEYLQENKNIAFSGLSKPDLLAKEVVIKLLSINQNPIKHVYETIDHIIDIAVHINNIIKKIGGKYL
jgi:DNA-directed RNA polymerase subunit L